LIVESDEDRRGSSYHHDPPAPLLHQQRVNSLPIQDFTLRKEAISDECEGRKELNLRQSRWISLYKQDLFILFSSVLSFRFLLLLPCPPHPQSRPGQVVSIHPSIHPLSCLCRLTHHRQLSFRSSSSNTTITSQCPQNIPPQTPIKPKKSDKKT
jgi:hypothetical protein